LEKELRAELKAMRRNVKDEDGNVIEEIDGRRAIIQRLISIALDGDNRDALTAIKLIYERTDGLPKQKTATDEREDDDPSEDEAIEALDHDELMVLAKVRAIMAPDVH